MNHKSLKRITKSLEDIFLELKRDELQDSDIRPRYAEYLTALTLAKKGHNVQLLGKREKKSADIYLPKVDARVEVKSACADKHGFVYASFRDGNQIKDKRFDYCVFVTFDISGNEKPKNIFVFTRKELEEVKTVKGRRGLADHEATNPCLLICAPSSRDYEHIVKLWGIKAFKIERKLCRHPETFRNAWGKIR
jgi:hypothetical protein